MSQDRQESLDCLEAEHDYQVHLDTGMEIHQLHKKVDLLLFNQGQRLLESQETGWNWWETSSGKARESRAGSALLPGAPDHAGLIRARFIDCQLETRFVYYDLMRAVSVRGAGSSRCDPQTEMDIP